MAPQPDPHFDFFIAHAGPDVDVAVELHAALARAGATPFVDARDLDYGDDWDIELPRAQAASDVSVILVSTRTDRAFYQREEIAIAINLARIDATSHRVVPIAIPGPDGVPPDLPYGLRLKHGIVLGGSMTAQAAADGLMRMHAKRFGAQRSATGAEDLPVPEGPVGAPAWRKDDLHRPDDLRRVVDALAGNEVVGITSDIPSDGVPLIGLGKATLAVEVAHDESVRRSFPGGIFWVEAGDDRARARRALAASLGLDKDAEAMTGEGFRLALRRALGERGRCLVIVNNVQSKAVAGDLVQTEGDSRVLLTTDDPDLVDWLGASPVMLGPLDPDRAEELLRRAAGLATEAWGRLCDPADVARLLEVTAYIPQNLAKAGRMIRPPGRSCRDVATELERRRDAGEIFRTTRATLDRLDPADARRWRDLEVFPELSPIPEVELGRLWGLGAREVGEVVDRLAAADLLTVDGPGRIRVKTAEIRDSGGVREADAHLMELHETMVAAYRTHLPDGGAWRDFPADTDVHAWDNLAYHLAEAGASEELRALVLDMGFLAAHAWRSGPGAVQHDLAIASKALPRDERIRGLHRTLEVGGHLLAGHPTPSALAATLRLLLLDAPPGVDVGTLDAHLPEVHLEPQWRLPRRLAALEREACPTESAVTGLAIARDGGLVASFEGTAPAGNATRPALVRWSGESESERTTGSGEGITALVVDRHTGDLVAGGAQGTVWKIGRDGRETPVARHQGDRVRDVAVASDGRWIASSDDDGTLLVTRHGAPPATPPQMPPVAVACLAASPSRPILALGDTDGGLWIWRIASGAGPGAVGSGEEPVTAVAFGEDGLLACARDGRVEVWSITDDTEPVERWRRDGSADALAVSSASGRVSVAIGSASGLVLWRPEESLDGRQVVLDATSAITRVVFSASGDRLFSGDESGRVRTWDLASALAAHATARDMAAIGAIAMSPGGDLLAAGMMDGSVSVSDVSGAGPVEVWSSGTATSRRVGALAFSADDDVLAWTDLGAREIHVARWRDDDTTILPSPRAVRAFAISPAGTRIAAACGDACVRVWDVREGGEPVELRWDGRRPAEAVAVLRGGVIVMVGADGLVRWNSLAESTGQVLAPVDAPVRALACSGSGKIAVGYSDGGVAVLDPSAGVLRRLSYTHPAPITALAFSADATLLASAANDGSAHLVELDPEELLVQADAGVRGLGLALATDGRGVSGSRMALLLDGAVLMSELVDRRPEHDPGPAGPQPEGLLTQ